MNFLQLRQKYHRNVCEKIIRITHKKDRDSYPNIADGSNLASKKIAWELINLIGCSNSSEPIPGQTAGNLFELVTKKFLEEAFGLLQHLRPGKWMYSIKSDISHFDQYKDLAKIDKIVRNNVDLATTIGLNYIVKPDIVIGRIPVSESEINEPRRLVDLNDQIAKLTPLRQSNYSDPKPILHASISCKWTLRSDRGQNARTEALNLIRNRKGNLPHIVAVTAEPTPIRIASLALGTGDIDCVYHFALNELKTAIANIKNEDQMDMLNMLIEGGRLRDISDLPFDLAI